MWMPSTCQVGEIGKMTISGTPGVKCIIHPCDWFGGSSFGSGTQLPAAATPGLGYPGLWDGSPFLHRHTNVDLLGLQSMAQTSTNK